MLALTTGPARLGARQHLRGAAPLRFRVPLTTTRPCRIVTRSALAIPDQYGFVMASVASTALVVQWMAVRVALARREYKVPYPAVYAEGSSEDALKFNCTQRAHLNTIETVPMVLALEILLGLQYPLYAAGLGMAWNIGRIAYALGYSTGDPSKRGPGSAAAGIVYLVLIFSSLYTGVKLGLGL